LLGGFEVEDEEFHDFCLAEQLSPPIIDTLFPDVQLF
jgi:hypothetical protein